MSTTNKNGSGIYDQISAYEQQYGGRNLFDIDANTEFTDEATRNQFFKDRNDYGNLTSMRDTYNAQVENAKKAQAEKEAYANTRRALMDRYIPETLQAMGLANTGLTADALLRAENNYNNYILGAKSESQQAQSDAMQSYRDAWQDYTMQKDAEALDKFKTDNKNLGTILTSISNGEYDEDYDLALQHAKSYGMGDYYQKEIANAITKREQKQLFDIYKEALGQNNSSEVIADIEEANKEGSITPEAYDELKSMYNVADADVLSGKKALKAPNVDGEYKLMRERKEEPLIGERTDNKDFLKQLKELGFNDPYDPKIPNGTTIKFHTVATYSATVTYYNGEWYISEKQ
jgi:hypothetical protein